MFLAGRCVGAYSFTLGAAILLANPFDAEGFVCWAGHTAATAMLDVCLDVDAHTITHLTSCPARTFALQALAVGGTLDTAVSAVRGVCLWINAGTIRAELCVGSTILARTHNATLLSFHASALTLPAMLRTCLQVHANHSVTDITRRLSVGTLAPVSLDFANSAVHAVIVSFALHVDIQVTTGRNQANENSQHEQSTGDRHGRGNDSIHP